jgi:hypothetical protein
MACFKIKINFSRFESTVTPTHNFTCVQIARFAFTMVNHGVVMAKRHLMGSFTPVGRRTTRAKINWDEVFKTASSIRGQTLQPF